MRKLLKYISPYKKECILGPLFKLLEASFELMVPLVMARVIDRGVAQNDRGAIYQSAILLVAFGVIGLISAITAQYFAAKASVGFAANVRAALFRHIQKLDYAALDGAGSSTLLNRMTSDLNQVQNGVNLTLRLLLRSPLVVFGAMIMAFTIDFKAALVFAVIIPILGAVVFGIMLWTLPRYKEVQGKLDKVLLTARENLTGVRVVRAFGREESETARFSQENAAVASSQISVGRVSTLLNPLTFSLINLATLVLIWVGGLRVDTGALTQGQVVALINYMAQILTELIKLADLIINISRALACAGRVEAVLEISPGMASGKSSPPQPRGEVKFENVSFRYPGAGGDCLSSVSFVAKPGDTIGIIGGTGSGKTALINLIPRLYDAKEGRVLLDGMDVRHYPLETLRDRVAVVPQRAQLFSGSVRENLLWGNRSASDGEIWQALEAAQAKDFVSKLGLDAPVSQGGRNFSGGQRQRLTIARALLKNPSVLILDDSMSALDLATEARLREALRSLPNHPTLFIVSQRAASVLGADLIIVLEDGEVSGMGRHGDLLQTSAVYREIYESQFGGEAEA